MTPASIADLVAGPSVGVCCGEAAAAERSPTTDRAAGLERVSRIECKGRCGDVCKRRSPHAPERSKRRQSSPAQADAQRSQRDIHSVSTQSSHTLPPLHERGHRKSRNFGYQLRPKSTAKRDEFTAMTTRTRAQSHTRTCEHQHANDAHTEKRTLRSKRTRRAVNLRICPPTHKQNANVHAQSSACNARDNARTHTAHAHAHAHASTLSWSMGSHALPMQPRNDETSSSGKDGTTSATESVQHSHARRLRESSRRMGENSKKMIFEAHRKSDLCIISLQADGEASPGWAGAS